MGESPRELVKQFKPALRFLGVFLAVYLVGNTLYGIWIDYLNPAPDPLTVFATAETANLLSLVAHPVEAVRSSTKPTVHLQFQQETRLVVYEGCNGVNVMIVFLAFTLGFGGRFKSMVWFIPLGLALIHVANLFRIMALYAVAIQFPKYFYYTHKYLFTASLYVGVLLLWWWWVRLNRVGHG